ncbi:MAG: hypothetical protein KGN16_00180 [Burkholderiales bacterium]|nr:hypothetical protein [Burkholderiales bacterium]
MAGTWTTLNNTPSFSVGTMLLLTDGSVLCHDEPNSGNVTATRHWWRLVPDATGSYRNGTWSAVADSTWAPLYFACSLLRDGRVFIAGGEYDGTATASEVNTAAIYNPVTNAWTAISAPTGWANIGDAPSAVLADGRVLLGDIYGRRSALYDPVANSWSAAATKDDARGTEETWVILPDQSVLAIECDNRPRTEKYIPAANAWVSAGNTPVTLVDAASDEVGAAILLPDGRVFCIGATNHTALYTPPAISNQLGAWAAGPDFPVITAGRITGAKDAPAALLPNGKVLCLVAPCDPTAASNTSAFWGAPVHFYEYDPSTNTMAEVTAPTNSGGNPYSSRLMLLPSGEVLHSNNSSTVAIYTPDLAPDPVWRPTITAVPDALLPGGTYTLKGRQLNGLSQAVIYGDEGAMGTNYPLVRLTNTSNGNVVYCRTHDHSTMGLNTGAVVHTTQFTVPAGISLGSYRLCVVANGIESANCVAVSVTHKRWKEIKIEIKETKELVKVEHDGFKLVFEDLRKISETDLSQVFGDGDWSDVVKSLADRSDQLETEVRHLRSFIGKNERPDVGGLVPEAKPQGPLAQPERQAPDPKRILPRVEKDEGDDKPAAKGKKAAGRGKRRA